MRVAAISALMILLSGCVASASDCRRYAAPNQRFENPAKPWNDTDTGIVAKGFVDLTTAAEARQFYRVEHGPDLSVYDVVDYGKIKECGGTFAFVRVDPSYAAHVAGLTGAGILPIPYFYFGIGSQLRENTQYDRHSEAETKIVKEYLGRFAQIAKDGAARFRSEIGDELKQAEFAGLKGRVLSVDIEEKLSRDGQSTPNQRIYYGRYYAHAACVWIRDIRSHYPDAIVLLYTTPSVYADYLQYAYPADNACLQDALVWIARTTVDGGDALRAEPTRMNLETQRLCLVSGGNRCVIHQYSHRATFASLGPPIKGQPPHMDVNRFFVAKKVTNDAGAGYVRANETVILDPGVHAEPP